MLSSEFALSNLKSIVKSTMALHLLGWAGKEMLKSHLNSGYCNGGYYGDTVAYPTALVQYPQPTVDVQIPNNPNQGGPRVHVGYKYPELPQQREDPVKQEQRQEQKKFIHYLIPCLPVKYRRLPQDED